MVDCSIEDKPELAHGLGLLLLREFSPPPHVVQKAQPHLTFVISVKNRDLQCLICDGKSN
jgi:hypothetical protein